VRLELDYLNPCEAHRVEVYADGSRSWRRVSGPELRQAQRQVAAQQELERLHAEYAALVEQSEPASAPPPERPTTRPGRALHQIMYSDIVSQHHAALQRVPNSIAHPELAND
jgi:hypothetical protein